MSKEFNSNKPLVIGSVSQEEDQFEVIISINNRSTVFDGHFPGFPILPGVILIDLIHELMAEILKHPVRLTEASNIKFLQVVLPGKTKELSVLLTLPESGNLIRVNASIKDENQQDVFKGQFTYVKEG
jgi:3-hydroxyacyl-[acyl-carrier-protein] dehydratase